MLKKVLWVVVPISVLIGLFVLMALAAAQATSAPIIDPQGSIGLAERNTLYTATLIMLLIVVPVFVLTFVIAIRYRAGNQKAAYKPEWASSKKLELIWWGVPILIVTVLSVIAWQTSHSLDPYKPMESDKKPLQIQVVALQWKWLFIYPDHKVASINEMAIPINTPVEFTITSDAPMNSFWIPQLGGQIYAMAGMSTKLHLDATKQGDYRGVSANISGKGHADMDFMVKARDENEFDQWISKASASEKILDTVLYEELRKPSTKDGVSTFKVIDTSLYDLIVKRYSESKMPENQNDTSETAY